MEGALDPDGSVSKRTRQRELVFDDGRFVWKACPPPSSGAFHHHVFVGYRDETDGAIARQLQEELEKQEVLNYPGLHINCFCFGADVGPTSGKSWEEGLEHSCLFLPILSDDAVRSWTDPDFDTSQDSLFMQIQSALSRLESGRMDVLPLLVSSIRKDGKGQRFSGFRFNYLDDVPPVGVETSPKEMMQHVSRLRGLYLNPKNLNRTVDGVVQIFSKQTWPQFLSKWDDQEEIRRSDNLRREAEEGEAIPDITGHTSPCMPRIPRCHHADVHSIPFTTLVLGCCLLSIGAFLALAGGKVARCPPQDQALCRNGWSSAIFCAGLSLTLSALIHFLPLIERVSRLRSVSKDCPYNIRRDFRWDERGNLADPIVKDHTSVPVAVGLITYGAIILLSLPDNFKLKTLFSYSSFFVIAGCTSLVSGIGWLWYSLWIVQPFTTWACPFIQFKAFPFYTGGELRAYIPCPLALHAYRKFTVVLSCIREVTIHVEHLDVSTRRKILVPEVHYGLAYRASAIARQKTARLHGSPGSIASFLQWNNDDDSVGGSIHEDKVTVLSSGRPGTPRMMTTQDSRHGTGKAWCTLSGIEVAFPLPLDGIPTALKSSPGTYWEIEVEGVEHYGDDLTQRHIWRDDEGFLARFLVPVYAPEDGF